MKESTSNIEFFVAGKWQNGDSPMVLHTNKDRRRRTDRRHGDRRRTDRRGQAAQNTNN